MIENSLEKSSVLKLSVSRKRVRRIIPWDKTRDEILLFKDQKRRRTIYVENFP